MHSNTISTAEPENTATGPKAASAGTAMNGSTVEVARDSEYAMPLAVVRIAVGKISAW